MGFLQRLFGSGGPAGGSPYRARRSSRPPVDDRTAPPFGPDTVAPQRFNFVKGLSGDVTQATVRWREWDRGMPPPGYERFGARRREMVFAFALPAAPGSTFQLRLVIDPLPLPAAPSWKFHFPSFDNEMELVEISGQGAPVRSWMARNASGVTLSSDGSSGAFDKVRLDSITAGAPPARTWLIGSWSLGGVAASQPQPPAPPPDPSGYTPPGWGTT